jgi:hypothetical protein
MIDELFDVGFKIARQVVVFQQDAVLERWPSGAGSGRRAPVAPTRRTVWVMIRDPCSRSTFGGLGILRAMCCRYKWLVAGLAAKKPEVIIALTSPAVRALKDAGVETPVVFAFVSDPVALGIVASLPHPGGNLTGVTYGQAAIGGKRLDLLLC